MKSGFRKFVVRAFPPLASLEAGPLNPTARATPGARGPQVRHGVTGASLVRAQEAVAPAVAEVLPNATSKRLHRVLGLVPVRTQVGVALMLRIPRVSLVASAATPIAISVVSAGQHALLLILLWKHSVWQTTGAVVVVGPLGARRPP